MIVESSEKSPARIFAVGTVTTAVTPCVTSKRSKSAKKNVLLRMSGPPRLPPYWF